VGNDARSTFESGGAPGREDARPVRPRSTPRGSRRQIARGYFAYLLRCGDGTFYAGYALDPARRLAAHRRGQAARYTRGRGPWALAAVWRCPTRGAALRLERLLKRIGRPRRLRLVGGARLTRVVPEAAGLRARRVRVSRFADPR